MPTQIKDIIDVVITKDTARILEEGFGVPILVADNSKQYERAVLYNDAADMLTINGGPYSSSDPLYKAALNLTGQSVSPEAFFVGRKLADVNSKASITFDADATAGDFTLSVSVAGAAAVETGAIAFNATPATALGNIETAVEALTGVSEVTITLNAGAVLPTDAEGFTIEFTGADANADFRITAIDASGLTGATTGTISTIAFGSAEETWSDAFTNIRAFNNTWYLFAPIEMIDDVNKDEIKDLALVVESTNKLLALVTMDADVATSATDDIASELKALNYDRTFIIFTETSGEWLNAAWAGRCLPENPGSINWAWQELSGITTGDYSTAELGYLKAKNANYFETIAGVNCISSNGIMVSGEYIDIMRGIDLLTARIGEALFLSLINSNKIPFTQKGLDLVENTIKKVLDIYGVGFSIITRESIKVTLPNLATIPTTEKAARWLNNVTFSATLQGAINKITVRGKVVV